MGGASPLSMPSGKGMCFKPMIGAGTTFLLRVPDAEPPFLGKEQLDTQAFYSLGRGTKGLPTPPSHSNNDLSMKLSKIRINPKPVKKNIKINF
jgi:hypothetical protein